MSKISPFQSTPPVKAATPYPLRLQKSFIFQSTPPVKAATRKAGNLRQQSRFQSTPPVKAATAAFKHSVRCTEISIHAAREGGDITSPPTPQAKQYFNPRRP